VRYGKAVFSENQQSANTMDIDGKSLALKVEKRLKAENDKLSGRKPCLAVIQVGADPASRIYTNLKAKKCSDIGMLSIRTELDATTSEDELLKLIERYNNDATIDGILVQLPVPDHISEDKIINQIDPSKDVDGFHPLNMGKLLLGDSDGFIPCTPLGIYTMFVEANIDIKGKHVLVIGRSNIVGKPMAAILMQNAPYCNATVTIANRHTANLQELSLQADVLIAAVGVPQMIKKDMVKKGAIVIDVGINRVDDPTSKKGYRIVGDVDYEDVKDTCSLITPVPGGVGPMTIAMLLSNTMKSYQLREKKLSIH